MLHAEGYVKSCSMAALRADAPYLLSPDFLHELFTKHRIDYVVHGDDPCLLPVRPPPSYRCIPPQLASRAVRCCMHGVMCLDYRCVSCDASQQQMQTGA
jgi:hypothetical protein